MSKVQNTVLCCIPFTNKILRFCIFIIDNTWNAELDSSILNQLQNQVEQLREKVKLQNNE